MGNFETPLPKIWQNGIQNGVSHFFTRMNQVPVLKLRRVFPAPPYSRTGLPWLLVKFFDLRHNCPITITKWCMPVTSPCTTLPISIHIFDYLQHLIQIGWWVSWTLDIVGHDVDTTEVATTSRKRLKLRIKWNILQEMIKMAILASRSPRWSFWRKWPF
jgi:hypothetical protein